MHVSPGSNVLSADIVCLPHVPNVPRATSAVFAKSKRTKCKRCAFRQAQEHFAQSVHASPASIASADIEISPGPKVLYANSVLVTWAKST